MPQIPQPASPGKYVIVDAENWNRLCRFVRGFLALQIQDAGDQPPGIVANDDLSQIHLLIKGVKTSGDTTDTEGGQVDLSGLYVIPNVELCNPATGQTIKVNLVAAG